MLLYEMQQMRRKEKNYQGAEAEGQAQIANGFSQFNNKGNEFCVCRHEKIQVYRWLQ